MRKALSYFRLLLLTEYKEANILLLANLRRGGFHVIKYFPDFLKLPVTYSFEQLTVLFSSIVFQKSNTTIYVTVNTCVFVVVTKRNGRLAINNAIC